MSQDKPTIQDAIDIENVRCDALRLLRKADALGVSVTITHASKRPLAMGNVSPVVEVWTARRQSVRCRLRSFAKAVQTMFGWPW